MLMMARSNLMAPDSMRNLGFQDLAGNDLDSTAAQKHTSEDQVNAEKK